MSLDIAGSFLQGLSEGMAPGLEARARHNYAKNERIAAAAFVKAKNLEAIDGSANLLADRFSGSEERGESWNALKNSLVKYANNNPNLLANIRKDISTGGGRYTFGDKGPPGSINIIGKLWRSTGLSQTERTLKRKWNNSAEAYKVFAKYSRENPKVNMGEAPTLSILIQNELSKMDVQGEPTQEQNLKAIAAAMEKRADYQQFKTGNYKGLLEEGILIKDPAGGVSRGIGGEDYSKLIGQLFTASPNSTQGKAAEVLASESGWSNLWGVFDDDDEPASLKDLNLNLGQQASISKLVSEIKAKGPGWKPKAAGKKLIIDNFLDQDNFNSLPDERREAIQELLQAAFS